MGDTIIGNGHGGVIPALVENGILNPDFTPNEQTADRMGWTLTDPQPAELPGIDSEQSIEALANPPAWRE